MSHILPFERVKRINKAYKDTVTGYIRHSQSLFPSNVPYYQISELIQSTIVLFYYSTIDSSMLTDTECDTLLSLFEKQNKFNNLGHYSYGLIYSSHKHGIGETIFKNKCHDKPHLLCLIQSTDGNVFGGYTAKGWTGRHPGGRCENDKQAFIFSIRSNKNYPAAIFNCIDGKALWNQNGYYCLFASHCAFYINGDGKKGNCNGSKCLNYEPYPNDFYLTGTSNFGVESVEVFQLK